MARVLRRTAATASPAALSEQRAAELSRRPAAGALAVAPPSPAITATTAPTSAVSPVCTLISVSVPVVIDGTSIDTLSVSISNRLSPGFTASPADLNHFVILPSATVSPSCGIKTSIPNLNCRRMPGRSGIRHREYWIARHGR